MPINHYFLPLILHPLRCDCISAMLFLDHRGRTCSDDHRVVIPNPLLNNVLSLQASGGKYGRAYSDTLPEKRMP